jgi:restriction system protein
MLGGLSQRDVTVFRTDQDIDFATVQRGIRSLTSKAKEVDKLNPQDVVRAVGHWTRRPDRPRTQKVLPAEGSQEQEWKQKLYGILTQKLTPAVFERLIQCVLRESSFKQVEITGHSGDGGIYGRGMARVHEFMSFHVLFQRQRYKGSSRPRRN